MAGWPGDAGQPDDVGGGVARVDGETVRYEETVQVNAGTGDPVSYR